LRLERGTRLGPYEVLSPIGSGGMGDVWEGRDSRLDRRVAIKVSREQFSDRFDREARAVAALNHPHICTLHDVGPNYLVMELIDGRPLAGPLPMAEAFRAAIQIADALEAAHRKGITHRDLKPANVLITRSGVKLLDFGLAKVHAPAAAGADGPRSVDGPTALVTEAHAVMGTPQYMSPEQLRGGDVDARSDIFSFGLVLHELFTGHLPPERSGAIAAAAREPVTPLPPEVGRLIRACLAEDPGDRFQSASDLKRALEWTRDDTRTTSLPPARANRLAWGIAGAAVIVAAALAPWPRTGAPAVDVTRFTVLPAAGTNFPPAANATISAPQFALSPDGRALVFLAARRNDKPTLWLRFMDDVEPRPIAGSDGASLPFWSPDNRWIGFFADGKIKRVLAAGGPAHVIAQSPSNPGGTTWNAQDVILIGSITGPITRVSVSGGPIADATVLQKDRQEANHRWPVFLPDGRHFLYVVRSALPDQQGVYVGSLEGGVKKRLVASNWAAAYAAGHLLYVEANTLMARPFDLSSLEFSGEPVVVAERIGVSTSGFSALSVSHTGSLAYGAPMVDTGQLTWVDRSGKAGATVGAEAGYIDFRLSPDEQRLAVTIFDPATGTPDIWLADLTRANASSKLTSNPWTDAGPVWSPDGPQIAFRTNRAGNNNIFVKTAGGAGNEQALVPGALLEQARLGFVPRSPTDWSGTRVLYGTNVPQTGEDLWVLDLTARRSVAYLQDPHNQIQGTLSPDGRFIAYSSDEEEGRFQVFVQTFPRSDDKWKISVNGGFEPRWSADGTELFYLSEDLGLMSTRIVTVPTFKPGETQRLFQTQVPDGVSQYRSRYDVSKDGKRFLVFTQTNRTLAGITTVLNWTAGLKR
jgi:Tol biopolymer transport system component